MLEANFWNFDHPNTFSWVIWGPTQTLGPIALHKNDIAPIDISIRFKEKLQISHTLCGFINSCFLYNECWFTHEHVFFDISKVDIFISLWQYIANSKFPLNAVFCSAAVQLLWRLLDANRQTDKQSMFIDLLSASDR